MKKHRLIILSFLSLLTLSMNSYAIQVKVISNSKKVMGIGFAVNGQKFGGLGSSYTKDDAPIGNYTFGLRSGGDVCCKTANGKKTIYLKKNSTALLQFNGNNCRLKIISR